MPQSTKPILVVVAELAGDAVVARPAVEHVVTAGAEQVIPAGLALEVVGQRAADQRVPAAAAEQLVGLETAGDEPVAARRAGLRPRLGGAGEEESAKQEDGDPPVQPACAPVQ